MASTPNYLDPQTLSQLQGLALRTKHVVNGFLTGAHRSAHTGSSAEYAQHRPYVPGDDLRHVDWKAFGRSDRLYVKQFMDETNLACQLFVDTSGSMGYQGSRAAMNKFEYASCLAAAVSWLLLEQGDAVGLTLGESKEMPAAANQGQLPTIIESIESTRPTGQISQAQAMRNWAMRTSQAHLVFVFSDLLDDPEPMKRVAMDLRQFGHELMVFQVCDPDERDFPFQDPTEFCSLESEEVLDLNAELFREGYLQKFNLHNESLRAFFERASIDFLPLTSDQHLGRTLADFLANRSQRLVS